MDSVGEALQLDRVVWRVLFEALFNLRSERLAGASLAKNEGRIRRDFRKRIKRVTEVSGRGMALL